MTDDPKALAEALIGTWKLVSFTHLTDSGEEIDGPFGEIPEGRIIYTQSGHTMILILAGDRKPFTVDDFRQASDAEKVVAFDTMTAYSGRYELIGTRVVHHVDLAWIPDWKGMDIDRYAELTDDGRLVLTGPPMKIGGRTLGLKITWEREA